MARVVGMEPAAAAHRADSTPARERRTWSLVVPMSRAMRADAAST